MQVLIVVGSQREGNSLRIGNKIKETFDKQNIKTELVIPGKQKINLCTGCLECDETNKCIYDDDMKRNLELFDKSDYIVFITPSRFSLLSGDLKIFIDRLNPLCSICDFSSKKFIGISVGQTSKEDKYVDSSLNSLIEFSNNCNMNNILNYKFYNCYGENDLEISNINKMCSELEKILEE